MLRFAQVLFRCLNQIILISCSIMITREGLAHLLMLTSICGISQRHQIVQMIRYVYYLIYTLNTWHLQSFDSFSDIPCLRCNNDNSVFRFLGLLKGWGIGFSTKYRYYDETNCNPERGWKYFWCN
jgi:hypothetical protein